jgi:hypothetical protein
MWLRGWLAACALAMMPTGPGDAAELIMFQGDGCPYCAAWEREIGRIYDKTELSRRAPLRRVKLDREPATGVLRNRIVYTPTFVVADGGREVGRIEGYPGKEFFWALLDRLLERVPAEGSQARPRVTSNLAAVPQFAAATE